MKKNLVLPNLIISASLLTLSGCLSSKSGGDSTSSASTSASLAWNSSAFPLAVKISTVFDSNETQATIDMGEEWEVVEENFFDFTTTTHNPQHANSDDYRDSILGIYSLNPWPADFSSQALAVTQLWGVRSGDVISLTHFDIFLNVEDYAFYNTGGGAANEYSFQSVMLHELGHSIGLEHNSSDSDSVMYPYLSSNTVKDLPQTVDLTDLSENYGIVNVYNSMTAGITKKKSSALIAALNQEGILDGVEFNLTVELDTQDMKCKHYINKTLYEEHNLNNDELLQSHSH